MRRKRWSLLHTPSSSFLSVAVPIFFFHHYKSESVLVVVVFGPEDVRPSPNRAKRATAAQPPAVLVFRKEKEKEREATFEDPSSFLSLSVSQTLSLSLSLSLKVR